ncbi:MULTISPECIES: prepilin-type N-terminal cleavage/methylation domain-containing protein [Vibrio]|uniref:prepilin-type N-terminal cleavage/methylation domain-containing protein n=1 Tax=Vibrio TaxID=662 RepID=UPI000B5CAB10|nr:MULTISPECIES: prepilin-type N-terminal cleavage/methylation domain-containing protein [Vibrio]HBV77191.1 prepilin-type N-terminal cleavage/methylation domain-containing protein [Vibrio sp.]
MKKQYGFSLLELIIVIVVISLIAIIALPKYIQIVEEAKKSSIKGVAAAYSASVVSARAQWEVARKPKRKSGQDQYNYIDLDGSHLWLTDRTAPGLSDYIEGYPMSVSEGSQRYIVSISNKDCVLLMEGLLQNPPVTQSVDVAEEDKKSDVRYLAKAHSNSCVYFQQEGAKHSFLYEMKTGRVTVNLQQ